MPLRSAAIAADVLVQVLASMGLQAEVPLCSIKLAAPDTPLLQVNSDDLMQLPRLPQVCAALACLYIYAYMFCPSFNSFLPSEDRLWLFDVFIFKKMWVFIRSPIHPPIPLFTWLFFDDSSAACVDQEQGLS